VEPLLTEGFTFVGLGSDGGVVSAGMQKLANIFDKYRKS
jgi:hypothetical protein